MINTEAWRSAITQPDWYLQLYPQLKQLLQQWSADPDSAETHQDKAAVYQFFEDALESGTVALGSSGQDLDRERQPVDTIVVHHTSNQPGYTLARMNATQMLKVYVPYFNNPTVPGEEGLKGQPLWSNHVRDGRPVFYSYHWLLRMDDTAERLLTDDQIGWHAGNWEVNCRSVGICLDNDYEHQDPTPETLRQLAQFIVQTYPAVAATRIFGHQEVSQAITICPGGAFTTWRPRLLQEIATLRAN